MAIEFGKGITLAGGFDLGAKAPLDSRLTVATIEDRDAHVTGNRAYEGMLVYVEADKITYQYVADADGNLSWKEFGFNEADFLEHVANDLTTDDANKALSAAQGVALKELIDVEAEAARAAEEELQTAIDNLDVRVGALPEGTTATSVIDYVNIKTAGIATDAALEELNNQVSGLQTAVQGIQTDYLTSEDKSELQGDINAKANQSALDEVSAVANAAVKQSDYDTKVAALEAEDTRIEGLVTAETTRATGIEAGLRTDVDAIKSDYLKAADKTALQDNIDTVSAAVELLTNGVKADEVDGVNDLIQYVKDHGSEVTGMQGDIAQNASDIAQNASDIAAIDGRVGTLEGEMDAVQSAVSTKVEQSAYDEKITALEGADTGLGNRIAALEGKFGEGDDSVSDMIATAKSEAIAAAGELDTALETKITTAYKKYTDDEIDKVETSISTLQGVVDGKAAQSEVNTISGKVGTLETDMAQAKTDIDAVEAVVATKAEQSALTAEVAARESLDARVVVVEGKAHTHANKDELAKIADGDVAKWNAIEDNAKGYTDAEIDKVEAIIGGIDADKTVVQLIAEAIETAEAGDTQAIADAQSYTDGKIAAVNSVIGTVASGETVVGLIDAAAAEAASDATSKANAAESNAKGHADSLNTAMNTRVEALEAIDHDHSNKTVLDGITSDKVTGWDNAAAKAHEHSNKTVLDGITSEKVTAWSAAEGNAKTFAQGLNDSMDARVATLESWHENFAAITDAEIEALFNEA